MKKFSMIIMVAFLLGATVSSDASTIGKAAPDKKEVVGKKVDWWDDFVKWISTHQCASRCHWGAPCPYRR